MQTFDFPSYPLWINLAVFAGSAVVVWIGGTRLTGYANSISVRTGIGKAFVGLILLGGVTSLPEVAVSVSSAISGNAALAVNNLLGGVAMQVVVLAGADAAIGRDALSAVVPRPVVLLQAAFAVLLLTLVSAGIGVGEVQLRLPGIVGVGAWTTAVMATGVAMIWLVHRYELSPAWIPNEHEQKGPERDHRPEKGAEMAGSTEPGSLRGVVTRLVGAAGAILVAGFFLSRSGEAVAQQTGLGASFVGVVLMAISTSLPEVSTVLAAVRLRQVELAVADIFGTNLFDIILVFAVDAVYPGGPVLDEVGVFSLFAALLGIAVTTIFIAGLIERRDRTVLRMGWDSLLVLAVYVGGLVVLYRLR